MTPKRIVLPSEPSKGVKLSEEKPGFRAGFWSFRSLIATLAAGALCLIAALSTGSLGIYFVFGNTLGRMLGVFLAALVVAVVGAAIMTAFKKRFKYSFSQCYSIGIVAIAGLSLVGSLLFKSPALSYSKYPSPREIKSARSAVVGIQNDIQTMLKETRQPDGSPAKGTVDFEPLPADSGDVQRIRELMQAFLKDRRFGNWRGVTSGVSAGSHVSSNSLIIRLAAPGQGKSGITRFARPSALIPVFPGPPL